MLSRRSWFVRAFSSVAGWLGFRLSTGKPAEKKAQPFRYETAAEIVSVTGWKCRKCRRFYGDDERAARWCCGHENQPCDDCGARVVPYRHKSICEACEERRDVARWLAMPRRRYEEGRDGMLYSEKKDRYYIDLDDWQNRAEEDDTPETDRLVICEPVKPRHFEMNDFLCDDLAEDGELDTDDIDKIVNDWIKDQGAFSWWPGDYALAE